MTYEQLAAIRSTIKPVKPNFLMVPVDHAEHDLNWAAQQIRQTAKPAGNVEKYNEQAKIILESATGLQAEEAGKVIGNYLRERSTFLQPLWEKAVRGDEQAMQEFRRMEAVLKFDY